MINEKIKRFCQLIDEINTINDLLDKERELFYDGGTLLKNVIQTNKDNEL